MDFLKSKKVYLYGTCTIDLFFPEAGLDAVTILEKLGKEVVYPQEQSCCGQPAYTSGYTEEAKKVAETQLKLFPEPYPIIVLSGSCAGMFTHHYPKLFKGSSDLNAVKEVTNRVLEFTEFLSISGVDLSDLFKNTRDTSVVVHTACSARREKQTQRHTDYLLSLDRKASQVSIADQSECCGFGGTFSIRHPELSAAMVEDKCQSILTASADELISADCACLLNINGRLKKKGTKLQGKHIASYIRQRSEE